MKSFFNLAVTALMFVFVLAFTGCSNDDDNNGSSLSGTTWKVLSDTGSDADEDGIIEDGLIGTIVKFNSDGNVTFSPHNDWTYAKWTEKDGTLTITVGEGHADDSMVGTYVVSGNTATYTYWWEDADGEWSNKNEPHDVMKMQKQ